MESTSTDPKVIAALIAASASFLIAVFSAIWNKRTQRKLEDFKSEIADRRALHDARLDYEYEARKRLYQECEPIFFQLNEAAKDVKHRIISLARTSRLGHLGLHDGGWLAAEGYYSISTYYNLFVPFALYKQIREALTLIDLNVDPIIRARYDLQKWLYISWTDDFEFARLGPGLEYEPNVQDWRECRKSNPRTHWRQGLPIGRLDTAAERLLIRSPEQNTRVRSFGEFESEYRDDSSEIRESFKLVSDIFFGFDPRTRPVLWRCLLAQTLLCQAIIDSSRYSHETDLEAFRPIRPFTESDIDNLDWRNNHDQISDEVFRSDFDVAFRYVYSHLPHLCEEGKPMANDG